MTLLLRHSDVVRLLPLPDCIEAVEEAFRLAGIGRAGQPGILGMPATGGGFHLKAATLPLRRTYFAAKLNANFPENPRRFGAPTIQGLVLLADGVRGDPLAVMDSMAITALRTGAATAVAARYLARRDSSVATICGCGTQGKIQLRSLCAVLPLHKAYAWDADADCARSFARMLANELGLRIEPIEDLAAAIARSDVCVTCTPSRKPFLCNADVRPGTFVAAVGADSADKQELEPALLARSTLVVDVLEQCATIGELHHALQAGLMTPQDVHAELGEVVAGRKRGRATEEEIVVFDSTGAALQDVAAAALVYERAVAEGIGTSMSFAE
jgi:alanine dehydrogenase